MKQALALLILFSLQVRANEVNSLIPRPTSMVTNQGGVPVPVEAFRRYMLAREEVRKAMFALFHTNLASTALITPEMSSSQMIKQVSVCVDACTHAQKLQLAHDLMRIKEYSCTTDGGPTFCNSLRAIFAGTDNDADKIFKRYADFLVYNEKRN